MEKIHFASRPPFERNLTHGCSFSVSDTETQALLMMACSSIFEFFRYTFFRIFLMTSLGPLGQMQCISSNMGYPGGVCWPFWLICK